MRAAVLGRPVGHSLSPLLHRAAYAALGLSDWTYDALDIGPADLPVLLKECLSTPGVHLIDCPIDYSENDHILNKEIKELSAKL